MDMLITVREPCVTVTYSMEFIECCLRKDEESV